MNYCLFVHWQSCCYYQQNELKTNGKLASKQYLFLKLFPQNMTYRQSSLDWHSWLGKLCSQYHQKPSRHCIQTIYCFQVLQLHLLIFMLLTRAIVMSAICPKFLCVQKTKSWELLISQLNICNSLILDLWCTQKHETMYYV